MRFGQILVDADTNRVIVLLQMIGRESFEVVSTDGLFVDLVGIMIGHIYYYLAEVYPNLPRSKGRQLLRTPKLL